MCKNPNWNLLYLFFFVYLTQGGKSNILEVFTMVVCLGYFMYDFCWCVWFYDSSTAVMLAHHLVSIAGISASLMSGYSGTEIGTCIFLGELSNPMLQLRYFMRQSGIKDGILYELNELTFLMTFIVCRAGIGSYLTFCHVMHPLPHVFFKIGGVALYVVSWIFIVQLLTIVFHKYSCRSSHDVKHAIKKDNWWTVLSTNTLNNLFHSLWDFFWELLFHFNIPVSQWGTFRTLGGSRPTR